MTKTTHTKAKPVAPENKSGKQKMFAIDPQNYKYIAIGFGIMVLGFLLMIGGGTKDPKVFNESLFSFTRITLAPILIIAGFVVEIYAIMKKPKAPVKEQE